MPGAALTLPPMGMGMTNHNWTHLLTAEQNLSTTTKRTTEELREVWLKTGQALLPLRSEFSTDQAFGAARKAAGSALSAVEASDAMWLASLPEDERADLYSKSQAATASTLRAMYRRFWTVQKRRFPPDGKRPRVAAIKEPNGVFLASDEDDDDEVDCSREETVKRLIERAESAKSELAKTPREKLERAQRLMHAAMQASYDAAIAKRVEEKVREERAKLKEERKKVFEELEAAKAAHKKAGDFLSTIDSHITLEEFRFIRSLLHPDKHPNEDPAPYNRAYNIFNRLRKMVNDKLPIAIRRRRGWA